MKAILISIVVLFFTFLSLSQESISLAVLKYSGGGDWYANPTSIPNLIAYSNENLGTTINPDPVSIDVGSQELFNYPFVHLTGHGNVVLSNQEVHNLRQYLIGGGFLHISDNYGLDKFIRREMAKVLPESEFIELPFDHPIYHQKYEFIKGLPKIHEHDNKAPQGFGLFYEGRLVCFYDFECDLGDGWEDPGVHNDSQSTREKALQMGANIIQFVFTQ
ncbi:MAG: DUF4159 domain-containing protein [Bacteroidales bacterium]|nr:DUF4159 domain-containing protein [Bacteroidales bacterium]MCF8405906.1 DUF4159 domain-containing protein [Bacteroidales bacterium]